MAEQGVHGEFFKNSVIHGADSEREKRPIFIDQHWIRIKVAGVVTEIIEREATDLDKRRFADEWAKYEAGQAQASSGTPLEMWPRMTPGMVATLKGLHILTVEDMATLSDLGCQKVGMGGYKLREDAQAFLNSASQHSAVMEVERLQQANADLAEQVADLKGLVEKMVAAQAPTQAAPEKRTRKDKAAA